MYQLLREIEWKRPHEIVEDPQLFVDGADRFDINQVNSTLSWNKNCLSLVCRLSVTRR